MSIGPANVQLVTVDDLKYTDMVTTIIVVGLSLGNAIVNIVRIKVYGIKIATSSINVRQVKAEYFIHGTNVK